MWTSPPAGATTPGQRIWQADYDSPHHNIDQASAIGVSPDGSTVYVTGTGGYRLFQAGQGYVTEAYDAATGAPRWSAGYRPPHTSGGATALAVSPDGSTVYVTGWVQGASILADYLTVAYDAATGAQRWAARYDGPDHSIDVPAALKVSPDGSRLFVTGHSAGNQTNFDDYATVAYDTATGAQLWSSAYDGPGHVFDDAVAVGVSPDGSIVFVTGESANSNAVFFFDYATVAYDAATGSQLWVSRYNGSDNTDDVPAALGVSPDGSRVYVTGETNHTGISGDFLTIAYDAATGKHVWGETFGGGNEALATDLGVSPDGSNVYVTGVRYGGTTSGDFVTIAYGAATGARVWRRRFHSPGAGDDVPHALAVSPDGGRVYVTGSIERYDAGRNYGTIGYDTETGVLLWATRAGPVANAVAYDVAVSPDGQRVYVTGKYYSTQSHSIDYGTVAYEG